MRAAAARWRPRRMHTQCRRAAREPPRDSHTRQGWSRCRRNHSRRRRSARPAWRSPASASAPGRSAAAATNGAGARRTTRTRSRRSTTRSSSASTGSTRPPIRLRPLGGGRRPGARRASTSARLCSPRVGSPRGRADDVQSLRRDSLLRELEGSLARLGVEAIDLYQIHWPIPDERDRGGLVGPRRVEGAGPRPPHRRLQLRRRAAAAGPVDRAGRDLQPPYSLIDRDVEDEILPFAEREGIGVIVYSPMASGLLTGRDDPRADRGAARRRLAEARPSVPRALLSTTWSWSSALRPSPSATARPRGGRRRLDAAQSGRRRRDRRLPPARPGRPDRRSRRISSSATRTSPRSRGQGDSTALSSCGWVIGQMCPSGASTSRYSAPISPASSRQCEVGVIVSVVQPTTVHGTGFARNGWSSGRRSSWCTNLPRRSALLGAKPGPDDRTSDLGEREAAGHDLPGPCGQARRYRLRERQARGREEDQPLDQVGPVDRREQRERRTHRVACERDGSGTGDLLEEPGRLRAQFAAGLPEGRQLERVPLLGQTRERRGARVHPSPVQKRDHSDTDEFAIRRWSQLRPHRKESKDGQAGGHGVRLGRRGVRGSGRRRGLRARRLDLRVRPRRRRQQVQARRADGGRGRSCSAASPTRASRRPGRRARGSSPTSSTATRSTSSRPRSRIRSGRTRPSSPATSSTGSRSSRRRPTARSSSPAAARSSRRCSRPTSSTSSG